MQTIFNLEIFNTIYSKIFKTSFVSNYKIDIQKTAFSYGGFISKIILYFEIKMTLQND